MSGLRRAVIGLVFAGSVALPFVPLAHADVASSPSNSVLTPSSEAWYQPNPTCSLPVGCASTGTLPAQPPAVPAPAPTSAPATSPWPAGTLHVAVAAGSETARSYVAFGLDSLDGTLSSASLDVPLDTNAQDGSASPDTATVQACPFSGALTPAAGSTDQPPNPSCSNGVDLTYVATPTPHLHGDLGPMLEQLSSAAGVALLPDARKLTQTSAWHVVFSAHDRTDAAKTAPATLTVTVTPFSDSTDLSQPAVPAAPAAVPAAPPVGGTGLAAPPMQAPLLQQPVAAPQVQAPQAAPVLQGRTITVGYQYPVVWLMPLAFLLLVPLTTRALTKDLRPLDVR